MSRQIEIELPSEYDTLNVGIGLYDPAEGTILDANDRLESISGYTTDELRTLSVERYTANTYRHSKSEFRDFVRVSAMGSPQQFTWRVKRADGELIWVRIHLSEHSLEDRSCVRAEVRDVTDYYDTNHREELFWRLLRHNLRNAATIIAGNTEQIETQAVTDAVDRATDSIHDAAMELGSMADSVKEIQQAVAQTDERRTERNAIDAVSHVAADLRTDYPTAEIRIDEREEMWINVDSAFTHALTHAIENAIVHRESDEPIVEIEVGSSPNTGRVEISISDSNPPISNTELDALFDRTETSSLSHGTGVGLFVMKWCVESLGGEIEFERRTSHGNTVYFYLPPKEPASRDG